MFEGRKLVIATMHEKERVISPLLTNKIGVKCIVSPNLNTDLLGTFTGEIERKNDPLTTARTKCELAMELTNCDLAIASEGSFGVHPTIGFIPANEELLLIIDTKNSLEIVVKEISTDTNYNAEEIKTKSALVEFCKTVKFPSHSIILRKSKSDFTDVVKGINNKEVLLLNFNHFISNYGTAYLETDMRAMHNPTRMKVIKKAALKLIAKIQSLCPECKNPGFGITEVKSGLPCERCHLPTRSILSAIHSCQKCNHILQQNYPHGKKFEEPSYCDFCNP